MQQLEKKNEPFYKHTLSQGGWKKQQMSFLSLLPVPLHQFLLLIASPFFAFLHLWTLHRPGSKSSQSCRNREPPASFSCPPRYLTWFEEQKRLRLAQFSYTCFLSFFHREPWFVPGVKNFFSKGSESKYFRLCNPYGLCHSHSFLLYCTQEPQNIHNQMSVAMSH